MSTGQDWFKPEIDKKTLKQLMRRDNKPALLQFGLFFGLLAGLAAYGSRQLGYRLVVVILSAVLCRVCLCDFSGA